MILLHKIIFSKFSKYNLAFGICLLKRGMTYHCTAGDEAGTHWLYGACFICLFNIGVHLVCYSTHYIFFGLFSYSYNLSVTVLTLWVASPKMFYKYWHRT